MQNNKDTIFALATPYGKSGVAIIRISGNQAIKVLPFLGVKHEIEHQQIKFVRLFHPDRSFVIDHSMVAFFKAPQSFTGEDIIELHIHGSKAIIKTLLSLLAKIDNFRMAEPGEFAKRSFLNGKMDLTEAEGLADLIEAETVIQHKQAIRQMSGELEELYESWKQKILEIMALVEAYIDFPDEDIPSEIIYEVQANINNLILEIRSHLDDNRRGEKIREGIYATIFGPPNVGKSSILNYLTRRETAIVSEIAGTTRDVIEATLDIEGYPVLISDTAGLRQDTHDQIEKEGMKRAINRAQNADIKIAVFDYNFLSNIDSVILDNIDPETIIVVNKCDQGKEGNLKETEIKFLKPIFISIKYEKNVINLIKALKEKLDNIMGNSEAPVLTRARHRQNLEDCVRSLEIFSLSKEIELAAEDLRVAADSLGKITGKIEIEEVLGKIFSKFCIGK